MALSQNNLRLAKTIGRMPRRGALLRKFHQTSVSEISRMSTSTQLLMVPPNLLKSSVTSFVTQAGNPPTYSSMMCRKYAAGITQPTFRKLGSVMLGAVFLGCCTSEEIIVD